MSLPSPSPTTIQLQVQCYEKIGFARLACSDWWVPLLQMVFELLWMIAMTCCLLQLVRRSIRPNLRNVKVGEQQKGATMNSEYSAATGYGENNHYDYCFVFDVVEDSAALNVAEVKSELSMFKRRHSFASIVEKLHRGKLNVKAFYSTDRKLVFVKVRATTERLCRQAELECYKLQLEPRRIRERISEGHWDESRSRYRWRPKAYSSKLIRNSTNPEWAALNYRRGTSPSSMFEYMILRDESRQVADMPMHQRRILAKVSPIIDSYGRCEFKYWQYCFGRFDNKCPDIYLLSDAENRSPFRGVDRLKLLRSIFQSDVKDGGCGLNISKMIKGTCIHACFALHEDSQRDILLTHIQGLPFWNRSDEIHIIKDYHGEKIGLYFSFLESYTSWLRSAAVLGIIGFAAIAVEQSGNTGELGTYRTHGSSLFAAFFASFMMLWSVAFLEYWKRNQITNAMKWGMRGFEKHERERPDFVENIENTVINSPVDGKKQIYFPDSKKKCRVLMSYTIIICLILVVVALIVAVFTLKSFTNPDQCITATVKSDDAKKYGFKKGQQYGEATTRCLKGGWSRFFIGPISIGTVQIPEIPLGSLIATTINSVNIIIFNKLYGAIAVELNAFENHATDTEYEDALIVKTFAFQMANSYGALFYIAFIQEKVIGRLEFLNIYGQCPFSENSPGRGRSCISALAVQLTSIFVIKIVVETFSEICVPFISVKLAERSSKLDDSPRSNIEFPAVLKSTVELQFAQPEFDVLMGPFMEYSELAIQFGYATLFAAAFPPAPLLGLISNYTHLRLNLYSITNRTRRPDPRSAEDIGMWESIFRLLSLIAVMTNCALIIFVGSYLKDYQEWLPFQPLNTSLSTSRNIQGYKWLLFFCMEHTILVGRAFIEFVIDDIPEGIKIQIGRQDLVTSKLIDDAESGSDEELDESNFSESTSITANIALTSIMWNDDDSRG